VIVTEWNEWWSNGTVVLDETMVEVEETKEALEFFDGVGNGPGYFRFNWRRHLVPTTLSTALWGDRGCFSLLSGFISHTKKAWARPSEWIIIMIPAHWACFNRQRWKEEEEGVHREGGDYLPLLIPGCSHLAWATFLTPYFFLQDLRRGARVATEFHWPCLRSSQWVGQDPQAVWLWLKSSEGETGA